MTSVSIVTKVVDLLSSGLLSAIFCLYRARNVVTISLAVVSATPEIASLHCARRHLFNDTAAILCDVLLMNSKMTRCIIRRTSVSRVYAIIRDLDD